jgi:hypothetical protein
VSEATRELSLHDSTSLSGPTLFDLLAYTKDGDQATPQGGSHFAAALFVSLPKDVPPL